MSTREKVAIWGCGIEGNKFIRKWKDKFDILYAIDKHYSESSFYGIKVCAPSHIREEKAYILVTTSLKNYVSIKEELISMGLTEKNDFQMAGIYIYQKFDLRHTNLESFKDKYLGKRCFLIGNGPSLKLCDLNMINSEISFACNRIYGFFPYTLWRPTFYFMEDPQALETLLDTAKIYFKEIQQVFLADTRDINIEYDNITSYHYIHFGEGSDARPQISTSMNEGVLCGATVLFSMLQFAFFMGFKQIILLGVDMNYKDSIPTKNDYPKELQNLDYSKSSPVEIGSSVLAYTVAKKYADDNGIKIYNATRGGKLEIFDRIQMESLF